MKRKHWLAIVCAIVWLLAFGVLNFSATGFQATYGPMMNLYNSGELHLWLAWTTMALPASTLLAWGVTPLIVTRLEAHDARDELSFGDEIKILGAATLLIAAFYRVLRAIFLLDLPITDEENSLSFGGELLASGHLTAPLDIPAAYFPTLFLFETPEGQVTSFDLIGPQLAWAFSHLTHTGPWIFSLFAALTFAGMWGVLRADLSRRWALTGCGLLFLSPAMFGLSLTTHTHVISRALIALLLGTYVWAQRTQKRRHWALAGAFWGASMITRPVETFLLTIPLLLMTVWDLRKDGLVQKAGLFLVSSLPFALLEMARNLFITGSVLPLRFHESKYPVRAISSGFTSFLSDFDIFLSRLSHNVAGNVELLGVWFLGLPGILLAVVGLSRTPLTRRLAVGCVLVISFGLLHDNVGVHTFGPIHQSELIIPLTICATFGFREIWNWLDEHDLFPGLPRAVFVAISLILSFSIFNAQNLLSVRASQRIHEEIYTSLEGLDIPPESVLFVPPLAVFWHKTPASPRSWVFELQPPTPPDFEDTPLLLRYRSGAREWALEHYPDRAIFFVVPSRDNGKLFLHDLREAPLPFTIK